MISTQQALANAKTFSVIDLARLELISRCANQNAKSGNGDFIELGVFRGGSAILLASAIKYRSSSQKVHLLDSWQGLPELDEQDHGLHSFVTSGQFSQSSEDAVRARLDSLHLLDVCYTYRGWVEDTLPQVTGTFSLAHIDLDLYKPVRYSLSWLLPRMQQQADIIIDDYGNENLRRFPGVEKAVTEVIAGSDWHIVETVGERDQSVRLSRE